MFPFLREPLLRVLTLYQFLKASEKCLGVINDKIAMFALNW